MAFPELDCEMIPVMSELSDIPDDLDLHFEDGCFYHRIALAESKYHRWLTSVDVGYREYSECPCNGVKSIDFAMFGYEITLFDQVDNVAYSTMDPLESRCAIPAEMRPLVVDITLFCYQKLLEHCDPEYIFRKTWLSEPCENGLKKHVKATEALTQSGYVVVKDGTDQYGCKFWLLGKSDSDHSGLELAEATDQLGVEQ